MEQENLKSEKSMGEQSSDDSSIELGYFTPIVNVKDSAEGIEQQGKVSRSTSRYITVEDITVELEKLSGKHCDSSSESIFVKDDRKLPRKGQWRSMYWIPPSRRKKTQSKKLQHKSVSLTDFGKLIDFQESERESLNPGSSLKLLKSSFKGSSCPSLDSHQLTKSENLKRRWKTAEDFVALQYEDYRFEDISKVFTKWELSQDQTLLEPSEEDYNKDSITESDRVSNLDIRAEDYVIPASTFFCAMIPISPRDISPSYEPVKSLEGIVTLVGDTENQEGTKHEMGNGDKSRSKPSAKSHSENQQDVQVRTLFPKTTQPLTTTQIVSGKKRNVLPQRSGKSEVDEYVPSFTVYDVLYILGSTIIYIVYLIILAFLIIEYYYTDDIQNFKIAAGFVIFTHLVCCVVNFQW